MQRFNQKKTILLTPKLDYENEIKRAIQKYLEDPLAKKIVTGEIKKGNKINITHIKNSESLDIKII